MKILFVTTAKKSEETNKQVKKPLKPKKGFKYYQYHGKVRPLSQQYDFRPKLVIGINPLKRKLHIPQYNKVIQLPTEVMEIKTLKPYYEDWYVEV